MTEIETEIRSAFKDVRLDGGMSLSEADAVDRRATEELHALPAGQVTADWSALPFETLENYPLLAYLDAAGFRYYIPAFMLSVLAEYEPGSMRVISTLSSLYPKRSKNWDYSLEQYSLLSREQCAAIAGFLADLNAAVKLDTHDQIVVERALRNYWHEFLFTASA